MTDNLIDLPALVHCRVGSLEKDKRAKHCIQTVHCRVGSLESHQPKPITTDNVHCRVGSLEKPGVYGVR